jgi:hypothetical protein
MEQNGEPIHDLLPFSLNGTLEAADQERFAGHLAGCAACREAADILAGLKTEIERHGEAFFEPHPAADRLVAACLPGPPGPEREAVLGHLALCPTCAVEARLVRGAGDRRRLKAALPWAIAASALVVAGLGLTLRPWGERATRVVRPTYVEQRVRAGGVTLVAVPEGASFFEIVLPIDLGPSSFPVTLEIRAAGGRVVFVRDGIREAYRDRFLFVECARSDFPDGDYVARATPSAAAGEAPPAPVEFAFRVRREGERR